MTYDHFITKFEAVSPSKWTTALKLCTEEEQIWLINLLGLHCTTIELGQLDYQDFGATGRDRIINRLKDLTSKSGQEKLSVHAKPVDPIPSKGD